MKRNVTHSILLAASLAALGCRQAKRGATVTAEFTRYGAEMSQGGVTLPPLPNEALADFPSVVKLDKAHGFQVEGTFQMSGRYRLERDSIFLDQKSGDSTRLAFAGRLFGDTLHLHWIPDYAADEHDASWELFFVRSH